MNIRKALLLTLIIAIASLGLTLTGCEKSDHPTGPAAEKVVEDAGAAAEEAKTCCGDDPSKCCGSKAAEEAKEAVEEAVDEAADKAESAVKEALSEHPTEHPE